MRLSSATRQVDGCLYTGCSSPKRYKPEQDAVLGGPFDLVSRVSKVGYGGL